MGIVILILRKIVILRAAQRLEKMSMSLRTMKLSCSVFMLLRLKTYLNRENPGSPLNPLGPTFPLRPSIPGAPGIPGWPGIDGPANKNCKD